MVGVEGGRRVDRQVERGGIEPRDATGSPLT